MVAQIDALDFPRGVPFDYQLAMDRLKGYSAPRNKLKQLCESGQVVRLKRGLYVWSTGEEVNPLVLAGLVYGPSYVSLETALEYHGLIPERTAEVTSICLGKASRKLKRFETPLGRFSYRPVNERAFSYGFRLESADGFNYQLAEPEKAVCDRIALVRGLQSVDKVRSLVLDDLRIDPEALKTFRLPMVNEIAARYQRRNLKAFALWLAREMEGGK
ncbi:MAG: hypothetical protein P1U89_18960 [Verrucomicrobiales bacterium]|nr:hypothetical protein [Verrucomicrobiales bacterium]